MPVGATKEAPADPYVMVPAPLIVVKIYPVEAGLVLAVGVMQSVSCVNMVQAAINHWPLTDTHRHTQTHTDTHKVTMLIMVKKPHAKIGQDTSTTITSSRLMTNVSNHWPK